jgi:RNA polymerase sigma factor (sigma-70 family)
MSPSSGTVVVPPTETPAERGGWSQALGSNAGAGDASSSRGHTTNGATLGASTTPATRRRTDEELARAAGRGDAAAFEALYDRHHLALLSFARHMLAQPHDAEDVVQHTFLAADRAFRSGKVPRAVRSWLFTVARNRCVSVLRARREDVGLPDAGVPSTENLASEVEHREDLRHLLADLRTLPEHQRAALLLAELGDLSHTEVAEVIGVRPAKVKALVFQARETLMASARARSIPCRSIREELAVATGADLRRQHLRHHLAQCPGCSEYAAGVRAQRASLAVILPVVPSIALREGVLAGLSGGAAATGAGAGVGVLAAKSTAAKLLTIAAVGGAAAGGGTIAVTAQDGSERPRPAAERSVERASAAPAPAAPAVAVTAPEAAGPEVRRERRAERRRDERGARSRRAGRERRKAAPANQHANVETAPGQARRNGAAPPGRARKNGGAPPGQARKQSVRTPPGQAKKQAVASPPGQAKKAAPAPKSAKPPQPAKPPQAEQPPPATAPAPVPAEQPLQPGRERKASEP